MDTEGQGAGKPPIAAKGDDILGTEAAIPAGNAAHLVCREKRRFK